MSSMRNAVQRRSHRERAQPLERQRFGLLEKHKDYSLRAKDFNKKKAQLKSLRQKAADRNEDEFYFGMLSRKGPGSRLKDGKTWSGTVVGDRGNRAMDVDTVRLLKTQDVGYVRTTRNVISKEVKRLEEQIVLVGGVDAATGINDDDDDDDDLDTRPARPRKIVFLDGTEARNEAVEKGAMDVDDEEGDNGDEFEGFDDDDKGADEKGADDNAQAQKEKMLPRLRLQLQNAKKKLKVLERAEQGLEIQRAKMAKTATSGGVTKKGKKIMVRTRKR